MAEIVVALDVSSEDEALHLIDRLPDLRWAKIGPILFLRAGTAVIKALKDRGVKVFLDLKCSGSRPRPRAPCDWLR